MISTAMEATVTLEESTYIIFYLDFHNKKTDLWKQDKIYIEKQGMLLRDYFVCWNEVVVRRGVQILLYLW